MASDVDRTHFSRPLKVEEIRQGARGEINATKAEMAAVAGLLDLVGLDGLSFTYRLQRADGDRLRLTGTLKAKVTQTCVISLEPVEAEIEVLVEAEFWPAHLIEELEERAEDQINLGLGDWPEPIKDGKIDLGPLIYETLATGLDPYPKRKGASFEWSQRASETGASGGSGPFAALRQLKRR
jgi:uncharacterized metal-binding protein YceD (DUF177 family)